MAKDRLPDPSEIFAIEFKGEISPIRDLLGFSDYQHRSVDFEVFRQAPSSLD
jgi:hypothetical protein